MTREAIYDEADVDQTVQQMRGVDYGAELAVTDGVTAIFHDAGHILGSAIIELRLTDGANARTVVFSGDLGPQRIADPPRSVAAHPRRLRPRRVDVRQPRARPA